MHRSYPVSRQQRPPLYSAGEALDVAAQAAERLLRRERIGTADARQCLPHERLSGVQRGARAGTPGGRVRGPPAARRRDPARSRRTSCRRRARAPARSGARRAAVGPAPRRSRPRPAAVCALSGFSCAARSRRANARAGSRCQPLPGRRDLALGDVGQSERHGGRQRKQPKRHGERGMASRHAREEAARGGGRRRDLAHQRSCERQEGEHRAAERGDLPEPVDRAVHEPHHERQQRDRRDGGGGAAGAAPAGDRGRQRRREEADEQQEADDARVREQPQLEAVGPARLLGAAPLAQVEGLPVVLAEAAERMIDERLPARRARSPGGCCRRRAKRELPGVVVW